MLLHLKPTIADNDCEKRRALSVYIMKQCNLVYERPLQTHKLSMWQWPAREGRSSLPFSSAQHHLQRLQINQSKPAVPDYHLVLRPPAKN